MVLKLKKQDIIETNSVNRIIKLLSQIYNIEYYIACGNNVEILYNKIKNNLKNSTNHKVTFINHLGWVGIRNEYKNSHVEIKGIKEPSLRDEKRIKLIVEKIKKDLT